MLRVLRRTALATKTLTVCGVFVASVAHADPPAPTDADPLPAARALFADALRDEEAGHFAEALDKFERVRAVRDTAPVEYRIGSCNEGLGHPVPAYRAYLVARTLAAGDPQNADVARAASERLDSLSKQVAQLAITTPAPASPSEPIVVPAPTPPMESVPPATNDSLAVAGWVAVGGAAALLTASAILLVARHDEIADLNDTCPDGVCRPGADQSDLESTRHRAQVYGPVGVTCGIAGIALAAAGVYWIVSAHRAATASRTWAISPMVANAGAGLAFSGALP